VLEDITWGQEFVEYTPDDCRACRNGSLLCLSCCTRKLVRITSITLHTFMIIVVPPLKILSKHSLTDHVLESRKKRSIIVSCYIIVDIVA